MFDVSRQVENSLKLMMMIDTALCTLYRWDFFRPWQHYCKVSRIDVDPEDDGSDLGYGERAIDNVLNFGSAPEVGGVGLWTNHHLTPKYCIARNYLWISRHEIWYWLNIEKFPSLFLFSIAHSTVGMWGHGTRLLLIVPKPWFWPLHRVSGSTHIYLSVGATFSLGVYISVGLYLPIVIYNLCSGLLLFWHELYLCVYLFKINVYFVPEFNLSVIGV